MEERPQHRFETMTAPNIVPGECRRNHSPKDGFPKPKAALAIHHSPQKQARFDETKNKVIAPILNNVAKETLWYSVMELKENRTETMLDLVLLRSETFEAEMVDLFESMQGNRSVQLHRIISLLIQDDRRHGLERKLAPAMHRPRRRVQRFLRSAVVATHTSPATLSAKFSQPDRQFAQLLAQAHYQAIQSDD